MKIRNDKRTANAGSFRLGFEDLEDRRLLATFVVSNTNDSGDGSLRRQVQLSNATPGVDEILFAPELTGETISLSTGQIRISQAVTIDGEGGAITIDASASDPTPSVVDGMGSRVFQITDNMTDGNDFFVEIRGLTITGGDINANGGAIHTRQVLRMYDVHIRDSHATGSGGGIYATKLLRIEDSTLTGNTAGEAGGGIRRWYGDNLHEHPVRFYRTEFTDNHAGTFGGGLAASTISFSTSSELLIEDCVFRLNSSESAGGGMSVNSYGQSAIRIRDSMITENSTEGLGGGVSIQTYNSESEIRDTIISSNAADSGGGISASRVSAPAAELNIINVDISDNSVDNNGGGVVTSHPLRIAHSRVSGNVAGDTGGGVYATNYYAYTTIEDSMIGDNRARRGGGIGVAGYGARLDLDSSTIYDNLATFLGGGIWMQHREYSEISNSTISGNRSAGDGGGIFAETQYRSFLTIEYSTVANNIADLNGSSALDLVGGIKIEGSFASVAHVISADNLRTNADGEQVPAIDFEGSLQSGAINHNLFETVSSTPDGESNLVGVDPMLGPLADNGGPTQTHAVLTGSPAIDAGAAETPNAAPSDQRGLPFARMQDGDEDGTATIDIGAFEFQTTDNVAPIAVAMGVATIRLDESTTLDGTGSSDPDQGPAALTYSWQVIEGPGDANLSNPDEATTNFTSSVAGDYTIELTVTDGVDSSSDTVTVTVLANAIPIADTSLSQTTGQVGEAVILDGRLSSDPEGDSITYQWTLTQLPDGSTATLTDSTLDTASFFPDIDGEYRAELIVNDGRDNSLPSEVIITIGSSTSSWHNSGLAEDVNNDGVIAPLDALLVINELTERVYSDPESGALVSSRPDAAPFLDVNDDSFLAPLDALLVVNSLGGEQNIPPSSIVVATFVPARTTQTNAGSRLNDAFFADDDETELWLSEALAQHLYTKAISEKS